MFRAVAIGSRSAKMPPSTQKPVHFLTKSICQKSPSLALLSRALSQVATTDQQHQHYTTSAHLHLQAIQQQSISTFAQRTSTSGTSLFRISVHRRLSSRMSSDADYMAFLDKANEDPSKGHSTAKASSQQFKTTDSGAQVPAVLKEATKDAFYVSDADEPFIPVCLGWEDEKGAGLPDEEQFASLINHPDPSSADIQIMDPTDWDTQGQYNAILDAVTKAGKGNDVRVYKVPRESVKVEYWVVTTDGTGKAKKQVIGVKALAVES